MNTTRKRRGGFQNIRGSEIRQSYLITKKRQWEC